MPGTQQLVAIPATIPSSTSGTTGTLNTNTNNGTAVQCPTCNGLGGMSHTGPCLLSSSSVTHACTTCNGRTVITIQFSTVVATHAPQPLPPSTTSTAPITTNATPIPRTTSSSIATSGDAMARFANQPLIVRNAHRCNLRVNDTGASLVLSPMYVTVTLMIMNERNRLARAWQWSFYV
jgi:hypothetical protein